MALELWPKIAIFQLLFFHLFHFRFVWNIWPRQAITIGAGPAGSDDIPLMPGPWSVKFYDAFARISGRYSIFALNLLFLVRIKWLESYLPRSWINKYLVNCSDIVQANLRLHKYNGVLVVVVILLHVWSIFLPCLVHGYSAKVVAGNFEWPLSERKPPGIKPTDPIKQIMFVQVDDVFRIVEMCLVLGVMMPLSYLWFTKRWHIAIHMHRAGAVVFFIDMVRRHTHPHSMVLNTPFLLLFLLDRGVLWFCHKTRPEVVSRMRLGPDYMVLFWRSRGGVSETIAPVFYIKLTDSDASEDPHPFTVFQRRSEGPQWSHTPQIAWSAACVIKIHTNRRRLSLTAKKSPVSHTWMLAQSDLEPGDIKIYGPQSGEMSELIQETQNKSPDIVFVNPYSSLRRPKSPLSSKTGAVLLATGSGINYLLDTLQFDFTGHKTLYLFWTTRDPELFDWGRHMFGGLVNVAPCQNVKVTLGFTGYATNDKLRQYCVENKHPDIVRFVFQRLRLDDEIPEHTRVFFQGSRAMCQEVEAVCARKYCEFVAGGGSRSKANPVKTTGDQTGGREKKFSVFYSRDDVDKILGTFDKDLEKDLELEKDLNFK